MDSTGIGCRYFCITTVRYCKFMGTIVLHHEITGRIGEAHESWTMVMSVPVGDSVGSGPKSSFRFLRWQSNIVGHSNSVQ